MQIPAGDGLGVAGPTFEFVPPGRRAREGVSAALGVRPSSAALQAGL